MSGIDELFDQITLADKRVDARLKRQEVKLAKIDLKKTRELQMSTSIREGKVWAPLIALVILGVVCGVTAGVTLSHLSNDRQRQNCVNKATQAHLKADCDKDKTRIYVSN